jgi:hypothetical protein
MRLKVREAQPHRIATCDAQPSGFALNEQKVFAEFSRHEEFPDRNAQRHMTVNMFAILDDPAGGC